MQRVQWVDSVRGIAIVLMVIFHFCYDLRYFGYVDWHVPNGPGWWQFRYLILSLFIFTLGVSLSLAHGKAIQWQKLLIRLGQMSLAAVAITLMSLLMFPDAWIYFGILHFLVIASVLGLVFVKVPGLALGAGMLVLLMYWSDTFGSSWPFDSMNWPPERTEDYVPVFPWIGVAFIGVAAGAFLPMQFVQKMFNWSPAWLEKAGRHGLIIYLLHQPVFFAGFYLILFAF